MALIAPPVEAGIPAERRRRWRQPRGAYRDLDRPTRRFLLKATVTLFALILVVTYLLPLGYGFITGLKSSQQMADPRQPILPMSADTATIDGEEYPVLMVPFDDGTRALALVDKGREASVFVDPDEPDVPIEWEGRWRTLEPAMTLDVHWENFSSVAETLDLPRLLFNTGVIAGFGMAGTLISSVLVAYGLSRFNVPFEKLIMASLIAAIILPRFVTIVPTYAVYQRLGWIGTWLPLIIPHFFANAYNVFLLRQFFLTIPRELDEAATIDGAGPLRILMTIIVPQARAAIVAVALFHFFFAWNDFFEPFVYLAGDLDKYPISVGLYGFIGLYKSAANLVQAGAIIAMAIPILVFMFGQRFFMKGIDVSGSLK
jgi:multiple sugar transport system permease protein